MNRLLVMLTLLLVSGCPVGPQPPAQPPVQDAGTDVEGGVFDCRKPVATCVCKKLCVLDCEECMPECSATVEDVIQDRIIPFDPECVIEADTKPEVRRCPGVECP